MYFPMSSKLYTVFAFIMQIYLVIFGILDSDLIHIIVSIEISMFFVLIFKYNNLYSYFADVIIFIYIYIKEHSF